MHILKNKKNFFSIYIFKKAIYYKANNIEVEKFWTINNYKKDEVYQIMNNKIEVNLEISYSIKSSKLC